MRKHNKNKRRKYKTYKNILVQEQLEKFNEKGLENYIDKKFKDLTENLSDSIKNQQHSSQKAIRRYLKKTSRELIFTQLLEL